MDGIFQRTGDGHTRYRTEVYEIEFGRNGRMRSLQAQGWELLRPVQGSAGGAGYYWNDNPVLLPCARTNLDKGWIADGCYGVFLEFTPGRMGFNLGHSQPDGEVQFAFFPAADVVIELPAAGTAVFRHAQGVEAVFKTEAPLCIDDFQETQALLLTLSVGAGVTGFFEFDDLPAHELFVTSSQADHDFRAGQPIDLTGEITVPEDAPDQAHIILQLEDMNTRKIVHEERRPLYFTPDTAEFEFLLDWAEPGPWHLSLIAEQDGCAFATKRGAVVYDLPSYVPKVYRPDDFWEFWENALQQQRKEPLQTNMEPRDEDSTDSYRAYDVQITGWNGRVLQGVWAEPAAAGFYPVHIGSKHPGANQEAPFDTLACHLSAPLEGRARFRTGFQNLKTTNLFYCCMDSLRWIDFIATRVKADLTRSVLFAGSRGGPVAIATLALDPRVTMHIANVPTNNSWQWQVAQPGVAGGWGPWLTDKPADLEIEEFVRRLAYFDPINFAKRVKQPCLIGFGLLDQLSQVTGNLAVFTRLQSNRKRICLRPWHGHDGPNAEWERLRDRWLQDHFGRNG